MTDVNGYLKKLDEIKDISGQKNRQAREKQEFQRKESNRVYAFRKARKIYAERKVFGSDKKEIKGEISDSDYALGRYFLGEISRKELDPKGVERIFGRDYAEHHFEGQSGYPTWRDHRDVGDGDKKVTNEEIGKNRATVQSIAYTLMEKGHLTTAIKGAKLYAKLGKGKKAIPKLVEKAEEAAERSPAYLNEENIRYMKMFIKKHGRERQPSGSGLEGKTAVFILTTLAGVALGVFSLQSTGNAVSNLTGTTQGLLGIFLFIAGLAGIFFHFGR